jgi:hypothetical protein
MHVSKIMSRDGEKNIRVGGRRQTADKEYRVCDCEPL